MKTYYGRTANDWHRAEQGCDRWAGDTLQRHVIVEVFDDETRDYGALYVADDAGLAELVDEYPEGDVIVKYDNDPPHLAAVNGITDLRTAS